MAVQDDGLVVALSASREKISLGKFDLKWLESAFVDWV
jgi:hypothetical protein